MFHLFGVSRVRDIDQGNGAVLVIAELEVPLRPVFGSLDVANRCGREHQMTDNIDAVLPGAGLRRDQPGLRTGKAG